MNKYEQHFFENDLKKPITKHKNGFGGHLFVLIFIPPHP
jgi:hypothetical protein